MRSITIRSWNRITRDEFFEVVRLRTEVFCVEQRITEPEFGPEDRDPHTLHYWVSDEYGCAAYLRVVELDTAEVGAFRSFGRVAVRADCRGAGLARALIKSVLDDFGSESMVIHAQEYITDLYHDYGFEVVGDSYLEAGIPHRVMYRPGSPGPS